VLLGERYKNITKETQAILRGEYGATPLPVDKDLQARVLEGKKPITCRPADVLEPELKKLSSDLYRIADDKEIDVFGVEDVLTYALFPQVGLRFLENRGDATAFEPPPSRAPAPAAQAGRPAAPVKDADGPERYQVTVNGRSYDVQIEPGGAVTQVTPVAAAAAAPKPTGGQPVNAPLAGTAFRVLVKEGQQVQAGEVLMIMEAMKMETEIRAPKAGVVTKISIQEGNAIELGQTLVTVA
jgi:oxaloacetate decarboxylase alpha subunit